ncbi:hypothetical protein UlMin_032764 [Ulmus minor]
METKKWSFVASLTIVVVALSLTFLVLHDSNQEFWEFKSIIQLIFGEDKPSRINNINQIPDEFVISPNLSSCHDSYGRPDLLVNCCPPPSEAEEQVIDFTFPDPSSPLRIRRPVHLLDKDYIAKYTKALSIMKSLPNTDPRSFSRQASLHCIFCSGAYDQKQNSILNIHRQWLFFPFHRMLLHFHERILGSLINDDTFALPFWSWDVPEGMTFPKMFLNEPFIDTERDPSHFFPKTVDLNYVSGVENGLEPQEQIDENMAFMYNQVVSSAKKSELFMGCSLYPGEEGFCDGPGTLESAPHNTVHTWVGSDKRPARENMGAFYTAGWDPSFFSHHGNLDRLWEVWREVHNKFLPITDPVWLNSYFYFHDENLKMVRIKVSDVLNITKLGYAYQKIDLPWLNERPKPSVEPKTAKRMLKLRETNGENGRNLENPIKMKVYRPKSHRTEKEKEEEEEVLVVYGIDVEQSISDIKFDVFVNLVDETRASPGFREFAGTFISFPERISNGKSKKSNMKLGISELLEDLEADEDESIWVTLFPRTNSCINVTVDGVRIET